MRAIGAIRVSTRKQQVVGLSLDAQKAAIATAVDRRGWQLVRYAVDSVPATKPGKKRPPELARAIEILDAGDADALVVARLDRLSRSGLDFWELVHHAQQHRWAIICLDPEVDLTTPFGEAFAGMAVVFAQLERALISQRTREAIAWKVANGGRHGALPEIPDSVAEAARRAQARGKSLREICRMFDAEGIPTARGGRWHPSTVAMILRRGSAD